MYFQRNLSSPSPVEESGGGQDDELVTISRSEWEELKAKFAPARESVSSEAQPAVVQVQENDRTSLVEHANSGTPRVADASQTFDLQRAYRTAILERELATALAEKPLVAGAAAQLIKLWREDLDVYEDEGTIKVAARDGRSVAQAVSDWLSSAEYSHFCLASSRGGVGAGGLSTSQGSHATAPRSLGEAILRQWKESSPQPTQQGRKSGWGRPR